MCKGRGFLDEHPELRQQRPVQMHCCCEVEMAEFHSDFDVATKAQPMNKGLVSEAKPVRGSGACGYAVIRIVGGGRGEFRFAAVLVLCSAA